MIDRFYLWLLHLSAAQQNVFIIGSILLALVIPYLIINRRALRRAILSLTVPHSERDFSGKNLSWVDWRKCE